MLPVSLQNQRLVVQLSVAITANPAQQGDGLLPKAGCKKNDTAFGAEAQNLKSTH